MIDEKEFIIKKFGDRIFELRIKHLMTQEQLAERSNLTRNHIGLIERGIREVRLTTLMSLALGFGITTSELCNFRLFPYERQF